MSSDVKMCADILGMHRAFRQCARVHGYAACSGVQMHACNSCNGTVFPPCVFDHGYAACFGVQTRADKHCIRKVSHCFVLGHDPVGVDPVANQRLCVPSARGSASSVDVKRAYHKSRKQMLLSLKLLLLLLFVVEVVVGVAGVVVVVEL